MRQASDLAVNEKKDRVHRNGLHNHYMHIHHIRMNSQKCMYV